MPDSSIIDDKRFNIPAGTRVDVIKTNKETGVKRTRPAFVEQRSLLKHGTGIDKVVYVVEYYGGKKGLVGAADIIVR